MEGRSIRIALIYRPIRPYYNSNITHNMSIPVKTDHDKTFCFTIIQVTASLRADLHVSTSPQPPCGVVLLTRLGSAGLSLIF